MLGELGYTGAFFAKYCSPAERYKCPPDGLAIFYRHARFDSMSNAKGKRQLAEAFVRRLCALCCHMRRWACANATAIFPPAPCHKAVHDAVWCGVVRCRPRIP